MYLTKIDFIPPVPKNLILSVDEARQNENTYAGSAPVDVYGSFYPNESLRDWIQQYYDYEVVVRYQIFTQSLPIHRDHGILGRKSNYIIEAGGDNVLTQWWDDEKNPQKILHQEKCETNTWYDLDIETPHSVINVEKTRYSITVRKK